MYLGFIIYFLFGLMEIVVLFYIFYILVWNIDVYEIDNMYFLVKRKVGIRFVIFF